MSQTCYLRTVKRGENHLLFLEIGIVLAIVHEGPNVVVITKDEDGAFYFGDVRVAAKSDIAVWGG